MSYPASSSSETNYIPPTYANLPTGNNPPSKEGETSHSPPFPEFQIESTDISVLKDRLKVIHQSLSEGINKSWTAGKSLSWMPFSSSAKMNKEAEAVLNQQETDNASDEGQPGAAAAASSESSYSLMERIQQAQKLASAETKWVYQLEAADLYLREGKWIHAQISMESALMTIQALGALSGHEPERIKTAQDAIFYLLGKISAQNGNLLVASQYFNKIIFSDISELVDESSSKHLLDLAQKQMTAICEILLTKVMTREATEEEKHIVAANINLLQEENKETLLLVDKNKQWSLNDLLDRYRPSEEKDNDWSLIARKIPVEHLKTNDHTSLGNYFAVQGEEDLAAFHYEKALKYTPKNQKDDYIKNIFKHLVKSTKIVPFFYKLAIENTENLFHYAESFASNDIEELLRKKYLKPIYEVLLKINVQLNELGINPPQKFTKLLVYLLRKIEIEEGSYESAFKFAFCYLNGTSEIQINLEKAKELFYHAEELDKKHNPLSTSDGIALSILIRGARRAFCNERKLDAANLILFGMRFISNNDALAFTYLAVFKSIALPRKYLENCFQLVQHQEAIPLKYLFLSLNDQYSLGGDEMRQYIKKNDRILNEE